jgi:RNA 2',3'-cyclic 3'-phosphodiesterase
VKERPKSPRVRLFVALDLPDPVLDELVAWQAEAFGALPDLRPLPRASLHITLAFLGYQAVRDVERIEEVAFEKAVEPFDLRPIDVVEVPKRKPRLYAVGLEEPAEALGRWQADLSRRLHEARLYQPEKRPFWPHVTVARVKSRRPARRRSHKGAREERAGHSAQPGVGPPSGEALPSPPVLPERLRQNFQARRLTLYQSTLRPQGAVYEPLARLDL